MKKKFIKFFALILCALTCFALFCACGSCRKKIYSISFEQPGYEAVVLYVEEGGTLDKSKVPNPIQDKEGYTIKWKRTNIVDVQGDIRVGIVESPNKYTISYFLAGGTFSEGTDATQTVTYDSSYSLPTPTRQNYDFVCWKYNDTAVAMTGTWKTAQDVTFVAEWLQVGCTIAFVQSGQETIYINLELGETLDPSLIPTPAPEPGYEVAWSQTTFENVQNNIIVTTVKTPKVFNCVCRNYVGASASTKKYTYAASYTLPRPNDRDGYRFLGYKIVGGTYDGTMLDMQGVWLYAEDVEIVGVWEEGEEIFTPWA